MFVSQMFSGMVKGWWSSCAERTWSMPCGAWTGQSSDHTRGRLHLSESMERWGAAEDARGPVPDPGDGTPPLIKVAALHPLVISRPLLVDCLAIAPLHVAPLQHTVAHQAAAHPLVTTDSLPTGGRQDWRLLYFVLLFKYVMCIPL